MPYTLSTTAFFFLNRNIEKTEFDKIILRKHSSDCDTQFTAEYLSDITEKTHFITNATNVTLNDHHELLDYMEDILDLLIYDKDVEPYANMDVLIPGYPIVSLKPGEDDRILLRVLRNWCKRV